VRLLSDFPSVGNDYYFVPGGQRNALNKTYWKLLRDTLPPHSANHSNPSVIIIIKNILLLSSLLIQNSNYEFSQ
jgi:hypothetical protein